MCTRPRGHGWEGRGEDRVTTCQQPCRWPPLGCLACRYFPSAPTVCAVDVFLFFSFFHFFPHFGPMGCWNHSVGRRYSRFFGCFIANQIGLFFCGARDCYCAVEAILEVQLANWLNFCYTFAPTPDELRGGGGGGKAGGSGVG